MNLSARIKILLAGVLILFISIPITLALFQTNQDQRSGATAGTTLSLIPQPGPSDTIQKGVDESVPIDVVVDPGPNAVTIIRMQVKFDPTKLEADEDEPFTPTDKFTKTLSPVINNDKISVIITTGSDPNQAIRTNAATAGTFNFKAIEETGDSPTEVSFTSATEVYSAGSNDSAREDILSTSKPAKITIGEGGITGTGTKMSFTLLLHGLGIAGDTPNPTDNDLSNKNPKNPEKQLHVLVFDENDQQVAEGTGKIYFQKNNDDDDLNGTFMGAVFVNPVLTDGKYSVKIKTNRYLRKEFPGTITIDGDKNNILSQIELVAGDTNGDNTLNIVDYNALLDCGYGSINPLPMTNSGAPFNSVGCQTHEPRNDIDIDDNGIINAFDYNLFIRELSVQTGD